jgi:hypothetical protein
MPGLDVFSMMLMGISSVAGAYNESEAQKAQGDYQRSMYRINARLAEFQAEAAISRGDREAARLIRQGYKDSSTVRKAGKRTAGAQRVALAAQGIDIGSGSALDVVQETEAMSEIDQFEVQRTAELDALTTKNNAWREAWGLKTQASNYESEARFALSSAKNKARNTLLTGGLTGLAYGTAAGGLYSKNNPKLTAPKVTAKSSNSPYVNSSFPGENRFARLEPF